MTTKPRPRKKTGIWVETRRHRSTPLALVVLGTIIVGVGLIIATHAQTPTANLESETGAKAGNVTAVSDANASGGSAVKFGAGSPSGQAMPTGALIADGHTWQQVFADDFTKDAATGSWGSDCDGSKIVYTGATGTQWHAYPKCYTDTYQHRAYRSDAVLSVHNGLLDFWLHNVDGHPAGANPAPILPSGSSYQLYGRYEFRARQDSYNLAEYYQAWLLWPQNDSDYQCAESDFPEGGMSSQTVNAFSHYGCNKAQDGFSKVIDKTQWHTYTQVWMPGLRIYYIDGAEVGRTTNQVWSSQQRWQLQTETNTGTGVACDATTPITCTGDGHLLVDWVTIYKY